jgi:L-methionine (R)-S-oxide reductase
MSGSGCHPRISRFLRKAGLESLAAREAHVERAIHDLMEAMGEKVAIADESSLYHYPVPMLTEDGSCSIVDEMAPVPYDPVLVKVSYVGRPSRAEFPLTPDFAERSTNSTVGLTGRATVIDDVSRHVEAGGGFYVCDDGIQSEACVPILSEDGQVAGIVDVEARAKGFFGVERLAVVAALAIVAAAVLP